MLQRRLVISKEARADLFAIEDYIAEQSGQIRATKVIERIEKTMNNLAFMPGIGRGRSYMEAGLRAFPAAPWTIVYDLLPDGDGINVIRIIDGRRNLPAIFRGNP